MKHGSLERCYVFFSIAITSQFCIFCFAEANKLGGQLSTMTKRSEEILLPPKHRTAIDSNAQAPFVRKSTTSPTSEILSERLKVGDPTASLEDTEGSIFWATPSGQLLVRQRPKAVSPEHPSTEGLIESTNASLIPVIDPGLTKHEGQRSFGQDPVSNQDAFSHNDSPVLIYESLEDEPSFIPSEAAFLGNSDSFQTSTAGTLGFVTESSSSLFNSSIRVTNSNNFDANSDKLRKNVQTKPILHESEANSAWQNESSSPVVPKDRNCYYCNESGYLEINLDDAEWKLGFICSVGFPDRDPPSSSCVVYFEHPVMLLFHEYYVDHHDEVSICDFPDCYPFYPREDNVWELQPLEYLNLTFWDRPSEGRETTSLGGRKGYNISFEMFLHDSDRFTLQNDSALYKLFIFPHPSNSHAGISRVVVFPSHCHLSGYPVLYSGESNRNGVAELHSACQCLGGSEGTLCQYGARCTAPNRCTFCGGTGVCSEWHGGAYVLCSCHEHNACQCDSGNCGERQHYSGACCQVPHQLNAVENYVWKDGVLEASSNGGETCTLKCRLITRPLEVAVLLCDHRDACLGTELSAKSVATQSAFETLADYIDALPDLCSTTAVTSVSFATHAAHAAVERSSSGSCGSDLCACKSIQENGTGSTLSYSSLPQSHNSSQSRFSPELSLKYSTNGEVLEITCTVLKFDNASVHWSFEWLLDGLHLHSGPSTRVHSRSKGCCTGVLLVETLEKYAQGLFTCEAATSELRFTNSLLIQLGQPKIVIEPRNVAVRKGGHTSLRCVGVNRPRLWKRHFAVQWHPEALGHEGSKPRWDEFLGPLNLPGEEPVEIQWAESVLFLDNITAPLSLECSIKSSSVMDVNIHFPSCNVNSPEKSHLAEILLPIEAKSTTKVKVLDSLDPACEAHLLKGVLWPLTPVWEESVQGCPMGFVGRATRFCSPRNTPISPSSTPAPLSNANSATHNSDSRSASLGSPHMSNSSSHSSGSSLHSSGSPSHGPASPSLTTSAPFLPPTLPEGSSRKSTSRTRPLSSEGRLSAMSRSSWQDPDYSNCLHLSFVESLMTVQRAKEIFRSFGSCEAKSSLIQRVLNHLTSYLMSRSALPGSCEQVWALLNTARTIPVETFILETEVVHDLQSKASHRLKEGTRVRCSQDDVPILLAADMIIQSRVECMKNWFRFLKVFHSTVAHHIRSTTIFQNSTIFWGNFTSFELITIADEEKPVVASVNFVASRFENVKAQTTFQWTGLSGSNDVPPNANVDPGSNRALLRRIELLLFKSAASTLLHNEAGDGVVVVVAGSAFPPQTHASSDTFQLNLQTSLSPLLKLTRGHLEALQCGALYNASSFAPCETSLESTPPESVMVRCSCPTRGFFVVVAQPYTLLGHTGSPLRPPPPPAAAAAASANAVATWACLVSSSVVVVTLFASCWWRRPDDVVVTVAAVAVIALLTGAASVATQSSLLNSETLALMLGCLQVFMGCCFVQQVHLSCIIDTPPPHLSNVLQRFPRNVKVSAAVTAVSVLVISMIAWVMLRSLNAGGYAPSTYEPLVVFAVALLYTFPWVGVASCNYFTLYKRRRGLVAAPRNSTLERSVRRSAVLLGSLWLLLFSCWGAGGSLGRYTFSAFTLLHSVFLCYYIMTERSCKLRGTTSANDVNWKGCCEAPYSFVLRTLRFRNPNASVIDNESPAFAPPQQHSGHAADRSASAEFCLQSTHFYSYPLQPLSEGNVVEPQYEEPKNENRVGRTEVFVSPVGYLNMAENLPSRYVNMPKLNPNPRSVMRPCGSISSLCASSDFFHHVYASVEDNYGSRGAPMTKRNSNSLHSFM